MDNDNNKISDFSAVGLDKFMRPIGAPASNQGSFVSGMDFNTYFDRNAVSSINLKNFSFNAGTGGTLVLGGTNNGNGNFVIRNAAGGTIVVGDNTGITITDGRLTFVNGLGGTVLDGSGVVSTVSFPSQQTFNGASGLSSTSASFIDIPGSSLNDLIITRSTRILFSIMGYGYNSGVITTEGSDVMEVALYDSFTNNNPANIVIGGLATTHAFTVGSSLNINMTVNDEMVARTAILTLAAGTHSMKLQYRADNGGTAVLDAWLLACVLLGN